MKKEKQFLFEFLDRTSVIMHQVDVFLLNHPATENKKLGKLIKRAHDNLYNAYQESGALLSQSKQNEKKHKKIILRRRKDSER